MTPAFCHIHLADQADDAFGMPNVLFSEEDYCKALYTTFSAENSEDPVMVQYIIRCWGKK